MGHPLETCKRCQSALVQPLDWSPVHDRHWAIERWCPECAWEHRGVFADAEVACYARRLDEGDRAIQTALSRLERARMEEEVERFVAALHDGSVAPMDF